MAVLLVISNIYPLFANKNNNMVKYEELKALVLGLELDSKKVDAGNQAAAKRMRKGMLAAAKLTKEVRLATKKE